MVSGNFAVRVRGGRIRFSLRGDDYSTQKVLSYGEGGGGAEMNE